MSKKFDKSNNSYYNDDYDYGERLHREKTKKIKRGKNRNFDDFDYVPPRKAKPLRKHNTAY